MNTLTTAPSFPVQSTLPIPEEQTENINIQLNKLIYSLNESKNDTSISGPNDHFFDESCGRPNDENIVCNSTSRRWTFNMLTDVFRSKIENLIFAYFFKNKNLNIGANLFLHKYSPFDHMSSLNSLIAVGEELFKNSRPRNDSETRIINDFVRSKTKILSSKKLV